MFEKQACKGTFSCQPHQPIMTTEHSKDQKCLIFPEGGKPDGLENPCGTAENQRTTQLTYGPTLAGNRTRVTLVRGNCFTHKPIVPPKVNHLHGSTEAASNIRVQHSGPNIIRAAKHKSLLSMKFLP